MAVAVVISCIGVIAAGFDRQEKCYSIRLMMIRMLGMLCSQAKHTGHPHLRQEKKPMKEKAGGWQGRSCRMLRIYL